MWKIPVSAATISISELNVNGQLLSKKSNDLNVDAKRCGSIGMRINHYRIANLMFLGLIVGLFSGCTDWKQEYEIRDAEYQELKSLVAQDLARQPKTIENLKQQILKLRQSPAKASGLGEDYDVVFDPSAGTLKVTLKSASLFAPGQAVLNEAVYPDLTHIADVLKSEYASAQVAVVGHTDSDPIRKTLWKDNWELSAHRALSVQGYLINKGVSQDHIWTVAKGASEPVASNLTASGKAQNRRVEIIVYLSE